MCPVLGFRTKGPWKLNPPYGSLGFSDSWFEFPGPPHAQDWMWGWLDVLPGSIKPTRLGHGPHRPIPIRCHNCVGHVPHVAQSTNSFEDPSDFF